MNPSKTALQTILALLGNVDHSVGNGERSAKMRGDKLNDIRLIAQEGIRLDEQATAEQEAEAAGDAFERDLADPR